VWLASIRAEGVNGIWASGKPGDIPEYVALHWHRELCQCGLYISPILVGKKWTRLKKNLNKELTQQQT
jgi:hypothetical protein